MNKEKEELIMQGIVEILESLRGQPNKYTQTRIIKNLSKFAYPNALMRRKAN